MSFLHIKIIIVKNLESYIYIIIYIKYVIKSREVKNMRKRCFRGNNEGDVLGIPMYLIIIMIVAVAVIAAVVVMIPKGTRAMNAQVTTNALLAEDPGTDGGGSFTFWKSYTIWVKVTTSDQRADPIQVPRSRSLVPGMQDKEKRWIMALRRSRG